jgi:MFS family permease
LATARESEVESTVPVAEHAPPSGRVRTFQSLQEVPPFRWYILSMTGNWAALQMQQVVRGLLVYYLTGSYAALGSMALANSAPRLVLALYGGVVADRLPKRYIVQVGQLFNAALALVIGLLLLFDLLRFEYLLLSAVLQGISNSFTQPARQALIPEIVGLKRLTNAVALNASGMNTMRLAAPALGGLLLVFVGFEWVYFLMAVMYLLAVLAMMRVPPEPVAGMEQRPAASRSRGKAGLADIAEAFRYLRVQPTLAMLLVVHLFIVVFSMPFQRLLPGFVADVLASTENQTELRFGLLMTLMGVGALAGSLVVASMPSRGRGRLLLAGTALMGMALLAFSASSVFWVSALIVLVLGVGQASRQALSTVLIQANVSNEYRGRISSVMMMQMGLTSFGTFGFGIFASVAGIQVALATAGAALLAVAATVYLFVPRYRNLD